MKTFLNSIDYLGIRPRLHFMEKSRFTTFLGGILSIICGILIMSLIGYFGMNVLIRKNVNLISSEIQNDSPILDYTEYQTPILITNNNGLKYKEPERWVRLVGKYFYTKDDFAQEVTIVNIERCDINKHFGKHRKLYEHLDSIEEHFCMVPNRNITLYGLYGGTKPYSFFMHYLYPCVNDTSLNTTNCQPKELLDSELQNVYAQYSFPDFLIDSKNITDPGQMYLKTERLPLSNNLYKRFFFKISLIKYQSDFGYLFTDTTIQNYFETAEYTINPALYVENRIMATTIMLSSKEKHFKRTFEKFQQVIANTGGIIKALVIMASVINYIFTYNYYYNTFINKLFSISPKNNSEHKILLKNEKYSNNFIEQKSAFEIKKDESKQSGHTNIYPISKGITNKSNCKENMKISFCESLTFFFMKASSEKKKMFHRGKQMLFKQMSIDHMISTNQQLEIIKMCLFRKEFLPILEAVPQPPLFDLQQNNTEQIQNPWINYQINAKTESIATLHKRLSDNNFPKSYVEESLIQLLEKF